jgi:SulP family sulfate permease
MDATGLHALRRLHTKCTEVGTRMVLSGVNEQPMKVMTKAGFVEIIGADNVCTNFEAAVKRAIEIRINDLEKSA